MEIQELIAEVKNDVLAKLTGFTGDLDGVKNRFDRLQCQVDAIDAKGVDRSFLDRDIEKPSIGELVTKHADFEAFRAGGYRARGGVRIVLPAGALELKSNITNTGLGAATSGVLSPTRLDGVVGIAQQSLRMRDVMRVVKVTQGANFDYVRQTTRTNAASPQTEASPKAESTYGWASTIGTFRTIAHYVNVSRQALDDNDWLQRVINRELLYGLKLEEESEILAGNGLGDHLNGIITQATAYDTGLNVASDTKLDKLRHAKLQARLAGKSSYEPDSFILNPSDMAAIELLKTEEGGANKGVYIVGNPKSGPTIKFLWDLPVVESDSIVAGTFLVGPFQTGAMLIDRMDATVDISFENSDNFIRNLATVLAEERVGLAVQVPSAFIYGSY